MNTIRGSCGTEMIDFISFLSMTTFIIFTIVILLCSLLKSMLERVKSGELDHCMDDIWAEIQRHEVNKYKLSEHQQPLKSTPTTPTEADDIKPEIPSHNPSTVEQSENQPPPPTEEVVQFVNDLNSWQDPYDVPSTVWTVSSGLGANLRGMPSVAKVATGPRRPGAVGRPRKRPLHPVRADLSNRLSMKCKSLECFRNVV